MNPAFEKWRQLEEFAGEANTTAKRARDEIRLGHICARPVVSLDGTLGIELFRGHDPVANIVNIEGTQAVRLAKWILGEPVDEP